MCKVGAAEKLLLGTERQIFLSGTAGEHPFRTIFLSALLLLVSYSSTEVLYTSTASYGPS
jgi:hypothetical protein